MKTYQLVVARKRRESNDAASLWFDVPADLAATFAYRTGQFLPITRVIDDQLITRNYSLASVPGLDDRLHITVKEVAGGRLSGWLVHDVGIGEPVDVAPPRGRLYLAHEQPRHHLLLAAGSGIVPLYAIARYAAWQAETGGLSHRVTLVYGSREEDSILLRDEVEALADRGVCRVHVLSRASEDWSGVRGRITPELLDEHWKELTADGTDLSVYLCGPEAFMTDLETWLVDRDVPLDDIRKESFDLVAEDDEEEPDLIVGTTSALGECTRIAARIHGETVEVAPEPGEQVLSALLRVSDDIPFSCQEGTCSSCLSRLASGQVGLRPRVLETLREADLNQQIILACLATPRSTTVELSFDDI